MKETIAIPRGPHEKPAIFEEFFGLDQDESVSPFLTPNSRAWSANLTFKAAIAAAVLLFISFLLSFHPTLSALSSMSLIAVYFLAGIPALIESIEDLSDFDVNIDVLMTLAAFSSVLIGSSMEGALLLVLFAISGSIEDLVTSKAKDSLSQLNKLSPTKATVIQDDGHLIEKSIKDIEIKTPILVRAGEIVPLDGTVIDGISSVNLVHLTGESLPVLKKKNDDVPAGARNLDGTLTLLVSHTSADSTLTRIIQLVTNAQEARPKLQRWFDKFSRAYALTVISLACFFAIAFHYILSIPFLGHEGSVYRAVAFLIAASPCALILALPIAYLSAISACARKGILLKGGIVLDALAQCKIIAFDKTGTLTTGELTCDGIKNISTPTTFSEEEILSVAYALEKNAVHPIAKAINQFAVQKNIKSAPLIDFKQIPGYGLQGEVEVDNQTFKAFLGHPEYIEPQLSSELSEKVKAEIEILHAQGAILAILLIGSNLYVFTFKDIARSGIKETLKRIKNSRLLKIVMLTGDHENSAKEIANSLGIDEYYANLRPEDKLKHVTNMAANGGLAMVGDGINDAPALARATVGIGMGKVGSGTALDASDVVLLNDNIEMIDWLMQKATQTQSIIKENLFIALGAILITSLPALAGLVPLWLAVIMHEGGTVLVGLNALRLLRK